MRAEDIIRLLKLRPLPKEGGYFRRTYQSAGSMRWISGERFLSTAIYYLVTPTEFSALHRLGQDELFHFYLGDPVEMVQLTESGQLTRYLLGHAIAQGQSVQQLAPGGVWQGTRLVDSGHWALLGTTVVPGYDDADFELGTRAKLIAHYPQHAEVIRRFTRETA